MANLLKALGVATAAYGLSKIVPKKPDGTEVPNGADIPTITKGVAEVVTGLKEKKAVDDIVQGKSTTKLNLDNGVSLSKKLDSLIPNPLEEFASYNVLWTLACLTKDQFNNPNLYRTNFKDLQNVVFSSAGRLDESRVGTFHGRPEYYINNFTMRAIVAANEQTGNTNAVGFKFDITEPYSMGLLLQSMQNAAINSGYSNYMEAPYVLRMDIVGFSEDGREFKSIKPKFFTLGFTSMNFQVTESGSLYNVEAIPYNHKAFSDDINITYNDLKIIADRKGTVDEILKTGKESLLAVLNGIEEKLVAENKIGVADVYDIQFPETSSSFTNSSQIPGLKRATSKPDSPQGISVGGRVLPVQTAFESNDIGNSSLGFTNASGGNVKFSQPGDVYDEKTGIVNRDNLTIDTKNRTFQFSQGQTIIQIITQIVLSSEYAFKALDPNNYVDGFIKWFRIDAQIEFLDYDDKIGDFARKYTFRVVPFLVHHSVFSNPTSTPLAYDKLQQRISKGYNYIYTGENQDIIKFDIQIDYLFYMGINPSAEKQSAKSSDPNLKGTVPDPTKETKTPSGESPGAVTANLGRARIRKDPSLIRKPVGGSGDTKTQQEVAEAFHQAFISGSSADLIKVNLEILGDTYWIVDSGFGNYFSSASPNSQITDDGTMNYESGDVFIYITFKTAADVDETTGLYQFSQTSKESPFSGIYRVIECENLFNDGKFTQKLTCVRMPGQALDYVEGGKPLPGIIQTKTNVAATQLEEESVPKTSPIDDISQGGAE